jgi:hypothetical protein
MLEVAMSTQDNPEDRFGFSPELMSEIFGEHAATGVFRVGCYVPTRREVMTMDPEKLIDLLDFWFWESPTELIPSDVQEVAVFRLLKARSDAEKFSSFIQNVESFKTPPIRTQGNHEEPSI